MGTISQEKRCSTCQETKSIDQFQRDRAKRDGYDYRCKECRNAGKRAKRNKPRVRKQADPNATEKACSRCKEVKPLIAFSKNRASFDGFQPLCKECDAARKGRFHRTDPLRYRERNNQWKQENGARYRELQKRHYLKSKYGLTQDQYDTLFEQQGGRCAICRKEGKRVNGIGPLEIDHDHTTGAVRGLLCRSCNMGIGIFCDDTDWMRAAITYIECKL